MPVSAWLGGPIGDEKDRLEDVGVARRLHHRPDREIGWHSVDDELHSHFNDQLSAMGAFVNGRVTYELMAEFWPTADTDPASTGPMVESAGIWRDMPKIVFSRTLDQADWNTTVVRDFVIEEMMGGQGPAGRRPGPRRVRPGRRLHAPRPDRRDRLYVHPVVIGRGKPMFQPSDAKVDLRLVEARTFGNGVVLLRYQRPDAGGRPRRS